MDVLKVIGIIVAVALILILYFSIEAYCVKHFGEGPLTPGVLGALCLGGWAGNLGIIWRAHLIAHKSDPLNGTVLFFVGVAVGVGVVIRNFVKLKSWFGLIATVVQCAVLPVAMFAPILRIFGFSLFAVVASRNSPEREIHHVHVIRNN
jgi:hypothetical protein